MSAKSMTSEKQTPAGASAATRQRTPSWLFPRILPPEFCAEQLAAMRESVQMRPGKIMGAQKVAPKVRRSEVGWIEPGAHEICGRVRELVFRANRDAGWFAHLNDRVSWQLTRYGAEDRGCYEPHQDTLSGPDEDGEDRKLSCVVQLSDRASYEGGEFSLEFAGGISQERAGHVGTAIVFPSYVMHGVKPVTKGERWSLVSWHFGPNWR